MENLLKESGSEKEPGHLKRKAAKLMLDPGELKFVIDDAVSKGVFIRKTAAYVLSKQQLGTIVEYFSGEMSQYAHLWSFLLAYSTINLLAIINQFPNIAARVATDSFYYERKYHVRVKEYLGDSTTWGTWREKDKELHWYRDHVDVLDQLEYHGDSIVRISTQPSKRDPIVRHKLVHLNGPGGCGKTIRVIDVFKHSNLIALTPTRRLARDFKSKGIEASTYHSLFVFFRWNGNDAWTEDRMGNKIIPDVIMWDEVCIVSKK